MNTAKVFSASTHARLERLRARLASEGFDGILISHPDNRRYYSGFTGSAGWLLISKDRALVATDSRYYEQVTRQCADYELFKIRQQYADALPDMLAQTDVKRLAFEADVVTVAAAQDWASATPGVEWAPTTGWGMEQRMTKDSSEVALVSKAVGIADEALSAALTKVRPGMTERAFARIIEGCLYDSGAHQLAFPTIVAAGPNGAMPHAQPSDTPLATGVPIVIDMGARVDGYCSDMSRTICLGEPDEPEKFWQVYNTVLNAQQSALAALRSGTTGDAIDSVARNFIAEAGYGDFFGHGLGHGVGLSAGEPPRLSRHYSDPLVAGALVTIEPGIYLPGWGGVRIEDVALITSTGAEKLTAMHKDPIVVIS